MKLNKIVKAFFKGFKIGFLDMWNLLNLREPNNETSKGKKPRRNKLNETSK
jgi:hypothetical protein